MIISSHSGCFSRIKYKKKTLNGEVTKMIPKIWKFGKKN